MWTLVTILVFVFSGHRNDVEAQGYNTTKLSNQTVSPLSGVRPQPMVLLQNNTHLNSTRKPRFFSGLSFLTGLGLGHIAGVASLDPSFQQLANYSIIPKLSTTTKSPLTDIDLGFGSSEFSPLASLPPPNVYSPNYPYTLALYTNVLLNKTLRSVQEVLEELKGQLVRKETMNSHQVPLSSDEGEQVEAEESNDVIDYKDKDDYLVVNRTILMDIVKASIAEQIENGNQVLLRQARPSSTTESPVPPTDNDPTPTDATEATDAAINTTASPSPSSTWQQSGGWYYGGQSQNISGVDLTQTYGPPIQPVYPVYSPHPEIYPVSPPVYPPVSFYQDERPNYYETYPGSTAGFNGISEAYPYYDHLGRSRTFSSRESKDLGGFKPSRKI